MRKHSNQILQECFHPKIGKTNLSKVALDNKRVEGHINKAHSNLRAMNTMFGNDMFDWAIICGYYAMYHAVLAALLKIGIRATAHYCAITAFKTFYVERGRVKPEYINYIKKAKQLEREYAETLEKAQETRVVEQYGIEVLTNDDAEWILEDAKKFVLKIEEVIAE